MEGGGEGAPYFFGFHRPVSRIGSPQDELPRGKKLKKTLTVFRIVLRRFRTHSPNHRHMAGAQLPTQHTGSKRNQGKHVQRCGFA